MRWFRTELTPGAPHPPDRVLMTQVALIVIVGTLLRVGVAWLTAGKSSFDIESYRIADYYARTDPLHFYSTVNAFAVQGVHVFRWPYSPGYLPWVLAVHWLNAATGIDYVFLLKLLPILADAATAYLVQDFLARRGHSVNARLGSAALVALGLPFIETSAFHGQFDSVAILPAIAAVWLWDDPQRRERVWHAGLLLGVGTALKTVPLILLLALLPTARGNRERIILSGSTVLVPAVLLIPFFLTDHRGVLLLGSYHGVIGLGGISLFVQPTLARTWLYTGKLGGVSPLNIAIAHYGAIATGVAVLSVGALLFWKRVPAAQGCAMLWLTVLCLGTGFSFQYLCWGIPFFLMSGWLGGVLLLEAAFAVPLALFDGWTRPAHRAAIYLLTTAVAWCGLLVALAWSTYAMVRTGTAQSMSRSKLGGRPHA